MADHIVSSYDTDLENLRRSIAEMGGVAEKMMTDATDALVRAVKGADKAAIVSARVFDVFTGQGVEDGHKSVAVEIVLQPTAKSFTDEEIKAVADKVVAAAAKQGATLRV